MSTQLKMATSANQIQQNYYNSVNFTSIEQKLCVEEAKLSTTFTLSTN